MPDVKTTPKTKDKKKQKNNEDEVKEEQLVLTPSENALGIRITQPKKKTVDTMTRLYAVPSEKLRVWTCWLTKVGERADDWQWWLRAQIGLALRISDHLQEAFLALEAEKNENLGQGDEGTSDAAAVPEESETDENAVKVSTADPTEAEPTSPEQESLVTKDDIPVELETADELQTDANAMEVSTADPSEAEPASPEQESPVTKDAIPVELETTDELQTDVNATEVNTADSTEAEPKSPEQESPVTKDDIPVELENTAIPAEGEPGEKPEPEEVSEAERSQGNGDKNKGNKGKKTKTGKLEPKIVYEEGFWPIGVRWKPLSQRGKRKPPPEREPDKIPIPENEEKMAEFIRKFKHQGVVYRSLYKHWSETADQAVKEIVGRKVLPTKQVYFNGEEIPYFFYLETEPDINYAIEHDDEEVLLPDPGREKITREFKHLYFNLIDKPGKGGKPWI